MTKIKKKLVVYIPILVGILVIIMAVIIRTTGMFDKGKEECITSSSLIEAIDIGELSTSECNYNGIAEIMDDDNPKKVIVHICYNAHIKAGISDINQIEFEIDDENKTVKPILPDIEITMNSIDEQSLSFMPENKSVDMKQVLQACKQDAETEAKQSSELINTATENLENTIEALITPILDPAGYRVIFDEQQ